jgi:hypothetical protein
MLKIKILLSLFLLFMPIWAINMTFASNSKLILGKTEKIMLIEKDTELDAKLDTGASMASLSAKNIEIFKHNNKDWIRFTVYIPSAQKEIVFVKPLLRFTHILKRQEEKEDNKKFSTRPVIALSICLGNLKETILVNLINRANFRYPMLLGSEALKKFNVLVDVSQKNLTKPNCSK